MSGRQTNTPARVRRVVAGLVLAAAGAGCGLVVTGAGAHGTTPAGDADAAAIIDAAHVPPLLALPGEAVTLRYDIFCAAPGDDPLSGEPCAAGGDVFARAGAGGPFRRLALRRSRAGDEGGRYHADVPADLARAPGGFSYYAVVRNEHNGVSLTIPPAGADAPQRVSTLEDAVTVALGEHVFGRTRRPDARVASARWGRGRGEVGVSRNPDEGRIGPSSFDVAADGTVSVLDQMNGRIVRWAPGGSVSAVAVDVTPAIHDMSVAADGTAWVLESSSAARRPVVRAFRPDGAPAAETSVVERTATQLRIGPRGPLVRQYPAEQWMPVGDGDRLLDPREQAARGRAGRLLPDGRDVVLLRQGKEVRVAISSPGGARHGWRVTSETPLAEVQLAEPLGSRLVVVVRVYTETADEFVVVVLGRRGLVQRFSVDSTSWAESAPLTRFRLANRALYRLGSSAEGVVVDRFDLEVTP